MVGAVQIFAGDELMLISNQGTLVRTSGDEISQLGRNTQGVRLINLRADEFLVGVQRIVETEGSLPAAEGSPPTAEGSPPAAEGSPPAAEGSPPTAESSTEDE